MNKTKLVSVVCALMGLGSYSLLEAAPVNDVKTYDFKAPFKDYNNKIVLSINNVPSAKVVEFTSNFKPKLVGVVVLVLEQILLILKQHN